MKVLHVAKDVDPETGGVARHIDGLIGACRGLAIDATVIGAGAAGLAQAIKAADVVHVHGARTPVVAKAALLAAVQGRPLIYTPHCYYDSGSPLKRAGKRLWDLVIERWLVRRASATILLDDHWPADVARRGLKPRRTVIIPNCITAPPAGERASAVDKPPGQPVLLSIGRLDPVKRLDDAILALADPLLGAAVLHIVGTGPDRERLMALAGTAGLAGRVIFHGRLDDRAVDQLRAGADLFLLPSEREGLPTVMLENLARGLPVLASDIPGNLAIADAVGWPALFPLGDRAALARGIMLWAGMPVPEPVATALAARFTWAARAPEIAALYQAAL